jgi:hypothetical protein
MAEQSQIKIDLVKLTDGRRLLRLTEPQSGLTLEKVLAPELPVVRQQRQLVQLFESTLAQAALAVG